MHVKDEHQPENLSAHLEAIRQQIDELRLATLAYGAVGITPESFYLSVIDGEDSIVLHRHFKSENRSSEILQAMADVKSTSNLHIVATAILCEEPQRDIGSRLWLEEDIVPLFLPPTKPTETVVREAALEARNQFNEHGIALVPISETQEVEIAALTTLNEYVHTTPSDIWDSLIQNIKEIKDQNGSLLFINATPQGGGVALMRHALIRLMRELEVPVFWHVLKPNSDVFEITKRKFHNVLQDVAPAGTTLTERDKEIYQGWITENAQILEEPIKQATCIVIDDPQPSGLIPHIKELNPSAKIIYRSHIHLDRDLLANPESSAHTTWQFLWNFVQHADLFVGHPVEKFIPYEAAKKTLLMPATTDPLDGLNKPLTPTNMAYYLKLFNKILLEHAQEPLDDTRPYVVQIARFDPSKGIPDVIEAYRQLREKLPQAGAPQLVLVGHGSIDDPDGVPVYNMTLQLLQEDRYRHLASDIKVVRLHHNDQILNAVLRASHVALQLSHKEGFEVKVSEALHKGKPVIAYRAGGIPLQIEDGKTGFLVEVGNTTEVAEKLHHLFTDTAAYETMCNAASRDVSPHHFTAANASKWLFLANSILSDSLKDYAGKKVVDLME